MDHALPVTVEQIQDGSAAFDVSLIEPEKPLATLVFAAGRGGHPRRHAGLLRALAGHGCRVVAPQFEMMPSSVPSGDDLKERTRRLEASIREYAREDLPLIGAGHSIGAAILLVMSGGVATTLGGEKVIAGSKCDFARLALFAPPTGFFIPEGALEKVDAAIRVWVGAKDNITPPDQARFLQSALPPQTPIEVTVDEEARHFSYMDELPPGMSDPCPDRPSFLASFAEETGRFLTGGACSSPGF